MKNFLLFIGTFTLSAFMVTNAANAAKLLEENRELAAFSHVKLLSSADVIVTIGDSQTVRVVADAHIMDKIETEVEDDTLHVGMKRGSYNNIKKMKVYITLPALQSAHLKGSGDLVVRHLDADEFLASLQGSGDLTLIKAKLGALKTRLQGSGDISSKGTCDKIEVILQGSGDVDAAGMKCESADVSLKGSGDVAVHATEAADIVIKGSGDVVISGEPSSLNSKVRGSGDVHVK